MEPWEQVNNLKKLTKANERIVTLKYLIFDLI